MVVPRVLITGFGPFPGVADNPSAWLAEALAAEAREAGCAPYAEIFPTAWETVAALTPSLFEAHRPRIMIHFGLCQRGKGFRIERSAHNRIDARADMSGALPAAKTVLARGPARLDTDFPATALAAHLRAHGLPAAASRSAGSYLCNFLYYRSLAWVARQAGAATALFVHVPQRSAHGGPFSEDELLRGARETLRFALDQAGTRDTHPETSLPLPPCGGARSRDFAQAEGGEPQIQNRLLTPLPDPPPQGGRGNICR